MSKEQIGYEKINIKLIDSDLDFADIAFFIKCVFNDEKFLNVKPYNTLAYCGDIYGYVTKYKKSISIEIGKRSNNE